MKNQLILSILLVYSSIAVAQVPDSLQISKGTACVHNSTINSYAFKYKQLIAPSVLMGAGVFCLENDWIKNQNQSIYNRIDVKFENLHVVDNFVQCVPMLAVYGLNLCGVKGKHNFWNRTVILGTSLAFMSASVYPIKYIMKVKRPDGSNHYSFPSGHTAFAFAGANFLWHEYKDVSPWIGISGFAVATGTGFLRMYNNKHWLSDVLFGAGAGIISTEIAYWLFPTMQRLFLKCSAQLAVVPFILPQNQGISINLTF